MTPKEVQKKRAKIRAAIKRQMDALEKLQSEECEHSNMKITHGGDTGNYDRSSDVYWTEYECPDCGYFKIK